MIEPAVIELICPEVIEPEIAVALTLPICAAAMLPVMVVAATDPI